MKLRIFLLVGLGLTLLACKKDYDPDLRTRWQLRTEIPANGTARSVDSIFYSFDNNVVSIQNVESSLYTRLAFGKFTQINDSLIFDYVDWDGTHDYYQKKKIILSQIERYYIVNLNSSNLHLRSKERELIFRKF